MNAPAETRFDVAIAGGGLAGLCLAVQLAEKKLRVILFEKERYPFHKVCGEYISMESYPFLQRIGLPLDIYGLPRIDTAHISSQRGTLLEHPLRPGGFGISRYLLDSLLASLAREKGAVICEGTKVTAFGPSGEDFFVEAGGIRYQALLLAGAQGKRSSVDKQLDRKFMRRPLRSSDNYIAVKYHVKADLPENVIGLHNFSGGYCGISRVENGRSCMCYLTTQASLSQSGNSIPRMEERVLMQNPFLKRYLTAFERLEPHPVTISQISFARKAPVEGNLLMAGDAAGLIPPLCGNGMSMAMQASFLLAEAIPLYLEGAVTREELHHIYRKGWNKAFSTRVTAGNLIQRLMGGERTTDLVLRLLKSSSSLTSRVIALTHGKAF